MTFRLWNEFWNSNFMEASFFGSCHWSLDLFAPSSDKVSETSINERNLKFSRFGIVFFQKEIRIFEEPPGVPEIEQLYSARTWRPHHSTKHPQNQGKPSPLLLHPNIKSPTKAKWKWEWAELWMVNQTPYWPTMIILVYVAYH